MADPGAFLNISRAKVVKEKPADRILHSKEFVQKFDLPVLKNQASRCMDCGVAFCTNGCPLGNIIPEFNEAVQKENWYEAYKILSYTNNFPEFTGRICPAPCEKACVLSINKDAVHIEEIEKHIIEIAFEKGFVDAQKLPVRTDKKVAVIGSGPAGLAAAEQLNKAGHLVTIYERDDKAGGLLRYGIPDFKLEKNVVDRRVELMKDAGIKFEFKAHIGRNISFQAIESQFDAILLAGGATLARSLDLPGKDLKGVHYAMPYLKQHTRIVAGENAFTDGDIESNVADILINARDRHVVVIGGGDTASDCIGVANRQGAKSVTQLNIYAQPPLERTSNMPWPQMPLIYQETSSHEEGCNRQWAVRSKELIGDESHHLKAIRLETNGHEIGGPAKEETFRQWVIQCDMVLIAIGFSSPEKTGLLEEIDPELDERGNVKASDKDFATSKDKIFVAGDMRRGQSLVVWAISEGRESAVKIDEYLMNKKSQLPSKYRR